MNLNKQISVWRGNTPPPTEYHLWIYNDEIRRCKNGVWELINTSPEILSKYLYSRKFTLNLCLDIKDINIASYSYDSTHLNFKFKGIVNIPIPYKGSYTVLLRLSGYENGATIIANGKTLNAGDLINIKFIETSEVKLELSKYCNIQEILIQETADVELISKLDNPDDGKLYVRKNNEWVELPLDIFNITNETLVGIKTTDKMTKNDKTPISSGGVYSVVGDVQTLLLSI